jgi:hypothetical protein
MGGRFSARGIGIVNMVVKSNLVPFFRHFQEVVVFEQPSDHPGFAKGRHTEAMGQFKLEGVVAPGPDQFFHDLKEDPGSILGHGPGGGIQDFIFKALEGLEPVFNDPPFHGLQKGSDGIGRAKALGFSQLLDSQGMKKWIIELSRISKGLPGIIHGINNLDQIMVALVEKQVSELQFFSESSSNDVH